MKFEYDTKSSEKYPVAGIDSAGDLYIIGPNETFAIAAEDNFLYNEMDWNNAEIVKVFYPGDKLTITF